MARRSADFDIASAVASSGFTPRREDLAGLLSLLAGEERSALLQGLLLEPAVMMSRTAIAAGSPPTEVLELTATLGIHAANAGVPILLDVLAETGDAPDVFDLDARQRQLKADFEAYLDGFSPNVSR